MPNPPADPAAAPDDAVDDAAETLAPRLAPAETSDDLLGTLVPGAGRTMADQTIRPQAPTALQSPALGELAAAAIPLHDTVELGDALGHGGMGVVRAGRQLAPPRDVAVKSALPSADDDSAQRSLLQEAWAAAALEHPNVVPIYALAVDRFGEPHVVMRRVSGRTWSDFIGDPLAVREAFGVRDVLGWHLGVLMQVCNALHFAHSQGVIHRDLKPDNVMIGRFGEVLVLDWGLAARLDEHGPEGLPLARDEQKVVGTPRFMAPEMARLDNALLSPRTDVYMLGGLLYALLTGDGPHRGETVQETLDAIPTFRPRLPLGASKRLESMLAKAMAMRPSDRFESAEAFRLAVQSYVEERSAEELADQANQQLAELEELLSDEQPDRERVYRRFGAARFGFEQALQTWPDSKDAVEGMERALVAMAAYELDIGLAHSAGRRLAGLRQPPPELVARQQAMAREQAGAGAELARLRRDVDPDVGRRSRVFVIVVFTLLWTAIPLFFWFQGATVNYRGLLQSQGLMLFLIVALVVWARDSLTRSSLNRRIAVTLVFLQVAILSTSFVGILAGAQPEPVASQQKLLSMLATLLLLDAVGPIALLPAAGFFVAALVSATDASLQLPMNAATSLLVAVAAWWVWGRKLPPRS